MIELDDWRSIHTVGHRQFVGGAANYWQIIGELQFKFLLQRGLRPDHTLLDIGCGSLRGGVHLINYLEPDKYLGVDKHIELIIYGVGAELGLDQFRAKRPRFLVSPDFPFDAFGESPHFVIAQSLFTHLTARDIQTCLTSLRRISAPGCRFFATFFEIEDDREPENPDQSNSRAQFSYRRSDMEKIGSDTGWSSTYIGNWNHPRGQRMIEYFC